MAAKLVQGLLALDSTFRDVSRFLWPFSLPCLWAAVALVTGLDHLSTFLGLEVAKEAGLYEANLPSRVALELGGFGGLFLWDVAKVSALIGAMALVQRNQTRSGLPGLGRLLHAAMLQVYVMYALMAVVNNLWLAFGR